MKAALVPEMALDRNRDPTAGRSEAGAGLKHRVAQVNQELWLWLILSLFLIATLINWLVASHRVIVEFYTLPTPFSAYVYGRRHAVLTAAASISIVVLLELSNHNLFAASTSHVAEYERWTDLVTWASLLLVTAYAMGSLYERKERHEGELRQTYFGLWMILQQFISKDKYTQNHSNRVASYAVTIGREMGFALNQVDDLRAALLHDIGRLEATRDLLSKAASLTPEEMRHHVQKGVDLLEPVGGLLKRALPIILDDKFDGTGFRASKDDEIPIEARVLAIADTYGTLTTDRPYRRAVTPFEAKPIIVNGAGSSFDPRVVGVFVTAFDHRRMEIGEGVAV